MKHHASGLKSILGLAAVAVACGTEPQDNPVATGGSSVTGGAPPITGGTLSSGGVTTTTGGRATGGTGSGGKASGGTASGGAATGGSGTAGAGAKSAGCGKTPTLTSGTHTITTGGQSRQYIIRIPSDYNNTKQYKLVFGLHWMGGTMTDVDTGQTVTRTVWSYYGLQQLDAGHTAIFVAPQGLSNGWGQGNADLVFFDDMIAAFEADLCIDTSRIFSIGFSYGGGMSYALACARAKVFRAVVVQDGAQISGCVGGNDPCAYMGVVGMSDPTCTPAMGRSCRDRFVKNNGCTVPASVPEWTSGQNHVCYKYQGCRAGYPVEWCTGNFTHKAAPCDTCCSSCDDGNKTWIPAEAWAFFNQF